MSHYLPDHPDQPAGVEFDPFLGLPAESEYTEEEAGWFERGKLFVERESGYDITASSEVMAILSLTTGPRDLKDRLARILIAVDRDGRGVPAGAVRAQGR